MPQDVSPEKAPAGGTAQFRRPVDPAADPALRHQHRPDIQGLRALCMVQVLLFHAWFVGSPVGVDAFIMISAFLMTGSFLRRSEAGRMPFFVERWATTFKRLLPPLTVTVLITLVVTLFLLPATRWQGMVTQSYASLTYWQNWLLASISTDYYAQDHALASPLQHLWSMSMQGQMFLLWPVLMALFVFTARRFRIQPRTVMIWGFGIVTVASLAWVIFAAPADGSVYFDTRARIWEFSLGSTLAAASPRIPRWLRSVALVVLVVFFLVNIGTYPGPMAAAPLLATSFILLGAPMPFLGWKPLVFIGDISYAVYLVHWPLFVFYLAAVGRPRLSIIEGLVLIAISILLAWILTRFVDNPFRRGAWANRDTRRKLLVAGATLAVGLVGVLAVQMWVAAEANAQRSEIAVPAPLPDLPAPAPAQSGPQSQSGGEPAPPPEPEPLPPLDGTPGALALGYEGPFAFTVPAIPGPLTLEDQWMLYSGRCNDRARQLFHQYPKSGCSAVGDQANNAGTVLVAGGSHAEQNLMPLVEAFATNNNLFAQSALQMACHWAAPNDTMTPNCRGHNQNLWQYITEQPPDYAFLLVTQASTDSADEKMIPGVKELVEQLTASGTTVFGVRDNLRSWTNLYECAAEQDPTAAFGGCIKLEGDHFAPSNPAAELEQIPGYHYLDMHSLLCVDGECPTIIGNVHVYLDTNHLTRSYAESMVPVLLPQVEDAR